MRLVGLNNDELMTRASSTLTSFVAHLLLLEVVVHDEGGGPLGVVGVADALGLAHQLPLAVSPANVMVTEIALEGKTAKTHLDLT